MCYPKPGPRCAAHLHERMLQVEEQLGENRECFVAGDPLPYPGTTPTTLLMVQEEYDETHRGQEEIAHAILVCTDDLEYSQARMLRARLDGAIERRARKMAALASTKAGHPVAAQHQLTYGAHAAWLEHSETMNHRRRATQVDVRPGEAFFYTITDQFEEQQSDGSALWVTAYETTYETPVRPGPAEGSWVTGDATLGRDGGDPLVWTPGEITPTGTPLVHLYGRDTGQVSPEAYTFADLGLEGHRFAAIDDPYSPSPDRWGIDWDTPEIVNDQHGSPVLLRAKGTGSRSVGATDQHTRQSA